MTKFLYATSPCSALLSFLSLPCHCTFCGVAICATFSSSHFPSIFLYKGHTLHLCPFSPHLKHSTSTTFCLLIVLSFTPHCITLLNNTSNLFWKVIFSLSSSFLEFLQFWTRCPNFLQLKHSFPLLLSSSSLSLVREYFCLSMLLRIELLLRL